MPTSAKNSITKILMDFFSVAANANKNVTNLWSGLFQLQPTLPTMCQNLKFSCCNQRRKRTTNVFHIICPFLATKQQCGNILNECWQQYYNGIWTFRRGRLVLLSLAARSRILILHTADKFTSSECRSKEARSSTLMYKGETKTACQYSASYNL